VIDRRGGVDQKIDKKSSAHKVVTIYKHTTFRVGNSRKFKKLSLIT